MQLSPSIEICRSTARQNDSSAWPLQQHHWCPWSIVFLSSQLASRESSPDKLPELILLTHTDWKRSSYLLTFYARLLKFPRLKWATIRDLNEYLEWCNSSQNKLHHTQTLCNLLLERIAPAMAWSNASIRLTDWFWAQKLWWRSLKTRIEKLAHSEKVIPSKKILCLTYLRSSSFVYCARRDDSGATVVIVWSRSSIDVSLRMWKFRAVTDWMAHLTRIRSYRIIWWQL